jgi:outer membrane protein OmpA-like peptidoglycan-associated protein
MAEFRQKVTTCGVIESVTVGAHTERLGKKFVNYKLSERRVASVAAEIMHIASNAPIDIKEFGSAQQVMQCAKQRAKKNVAHCPAPNRRTMIDAQEIAN